MLEINRIDTGPCRLLLKLESQNPGNSIKDRIAISMIDRAESEGALKPGGHIVEATAGNTGIALALVGTQRGYSVTVVVPDKMAEGKIAHLRALGAEVVMARSDVEKGHPDYYQEVAAKIASERGAYYVNQFSNQANVDAHYETTGPEIWEQTNGEIDAFVVGVGSGGTVTGVGRYLKEKKPDVRIVLADPVGSVLEPLVNENRKVDAGSWLVEGIGEDFIPDITDMDVIDEAIAVSDGDAFVAARDLLRKQGLLSGSSSGTLLAAALIWCRRQTEPKTVVSFACDHGAKYLDKMFNDHWMMDQGFLEREEHGNLRDLIARRHKHGEDYTIREDLPLMQAIKAMKLHDVSQMAVFDENDSIKGILDESDILMAVTKDPENFNEPVSKFMTSRLVTVSPKDSIDDLLPIFRSDQVAIVMEDDSFCGLITRIDLINYLRKKLLR
ncbi:MAG: cystathionine beta-synthase [Phycisphaerae bacterium]|nr:cystathionine beta-synthase [Phycisphaerae bacterium]|tara:strand:- start:912 stop:2237 length:1326 start_codon:yes stop_codon:yes gene_type:complete